MTYIFFWFVIEAVLLFEYRSRIVLTSKDTHRVPMGPAYLESPSGRVFRNIRSLACNQDIERNASNRPWTTPLDWTAYRDSWEAGVEWAVNTLGSDTLVDSEHKALLISRRLQCGANKNPEYPE